VRERHFERARTQLNQMIPHTSFQAVRVGADGQVIH
jgi:hypothetical protein